MSHHIYNTPGFVLGSTPTGEASRFVYVFTRDLGLVGAHAQNARNINSKLRYALDAPAFSQVSLVRGKNIWRLTNAIPDKSFYSFFKENPEKLKLSVKIFSLIKKLLAGEEANPELFSLIESFFVYLGKEDLNSEALQNIEAILILRILNLLGYVPENDIAHEFAYGVDWDSELISKMMPKRREAVKIINESLRAADL